MECSHCHIDKPSEDFFKGTVCYSCIYKEKVAKEPDLEKPLKICRICKKFIPRTRKHNAETCSAKCSAENKKNYWVYQINNIAPLPKRLYYGNKKSELSRS